MKPHAFLDIETTGLDPVKHQILEVAIILDPEPLAILHPDPEYTLHFSLAINPVRASHKALKVNRYEERAFDLKQIEVDPDDAARALVKALSDRVVVGNNTQFDMRFIENFLRQQGADDPTPWHYHLIDVKALVAGMCRLGPAPWLTGKIADAIGVPVPEDAHAAMADAAWNKQVYQAVTA